MNFSSKFYSNLNFKERQVTRRVCRRLWKFVDENTAGADKLSIYLTARELARPPATIDMSSGSMNMEKMDLDVKIWPEDLEESLDEPHALLVQQDQLAELLRFLPPLRCIRPNKLSLQNDWSLDGRGLVAALIQHLAEHQVARSVTSIKKRQHSPLGHALKSNRHAQCLIV